MDSSVILVYQWYYWANIIYILGMFGYLAVDTLNYLLIPADISLSPFINIFLAILFVIDAIFYTIDWYQHAVKSRKNEDEPIKYEAGFIACIFQNLGSFFYLISSFLTFNKSLFMGKILLLNLIGIIAFLIESILTFTAWRISFLRKPTNNPKRGCVSQDVYMWANIMNIVGGLVYLCATTLAYRLYISLNFVNLDAVLIVQMFGDLVYLFDALLYYDCWQQDKQDYDTNSEQQRLIEFNLLKQFCIEDTIPVPISKPYFE